MSQLIYPKDFTNIKKTTNSTAAQTFTAKHNDTVFLDSPPLYFLFQPRDMLFIADDNTSHAAFSLDRLDADGPLNCSYTKDLTPTTLAWSVKLKNGQVHFIQTANVTGIVSQNQSNVSGTLTGTLEDGSTVGIDFNARVK